jgi:16S rRNA (cytosine967-C5)-methyltransferase
MPAITRALAAKGAIDPLVEALLWCSLYAFDGRRYAEYTVVNQAVRACDVLGKGQAKGFVNALLRRYLRERASLEARIATREEVACQHPGWWIDALKRAWPADWEGIVSAGNARPPMTLRVNRRRVTRDAYLGRLRDAGLDATVAGDAALLLQTPCPVNRLPGFASGDVSVQDAGAQRTAFLLDAGDGMSVLDACAAPGGKCAHVLELADVRMLALDVDDARVARIRQNLDRLGLRADVRTADCTCPQDWWDGRAYDRILADVPCSGSGVARRHPDIKWLRRPGDLVRFAAKQGEILDALWRLLAPGGTLLYVTCSVFPEENEAVVEAFCRRTPEARWLELSDGLPPGLPPGPTRDGFFHARLHRAA